jgi:hypothetical protein
MKLDFSIFSQPSTKICGTGGTGGTINVHAGFSVPPTVKASWDRGDRSSDAGVWSHESHERPTSEGTENPSVYAGVPPVPRVPPQNGGVCADVVLDGIPPHDPAEWRGTFVQWLNSACAYHPRCFGGIGCLHLAFCDWEIAHDGVPCTRDTFERLLEESDHLIADGLVSGLILREDFAWANSKEIK